MPNARKRRDGVGPAGRPRARGRARPEARTRTSGTKLRPHAHRWACLPHRPVRVGRGRRANDRRDATVPGRSRLRADDDRSGDLGALGSHPAGARLCGHPNKRGGRRARRRRGWRSRRPSRSRRCRRSGPRSGHGRRRRLGARRRRGHGRHRRREEEQRVEVPLGIGDTADPEVDVRDGELRHTARADGPNPVALGHGRAAGDPQRAQVEQRRGVPVGRCDRKRLATGRHGAHEGDRPARRCDHRRARGRTDVDAAMEAALVRIGAEAERAQDRPLHRPRPAVGRGGSDESRDRRAHRQAPVDRPDLLPALQTTATVPRRPFRCQL
jgi:hypothetical protein